MKQYYLDVKTKVRDFFFDYEGGKKTLKQQNTKITVAGVFTLITLLQFLRSIDNSDLSKTYKPFCPGFFWRDKKKSSSASSVEINLLTESQANAKRKGSVGIPLKRPSEVVYSGKQVFERSGADSLMTPLPSGSNFIGKLLSSINTNEQGQVIKVTLPYGARHQRAGSIPKDTILHGTATPDGETEKVFIRFHKIIFPDGKEFRIDAQALNSADYSPGLLGIRHSNTDLKMASSIGLTMVSAASDVLTQRSGMGSIGGMVMGPDSPDATMKNAILQGVSQASRQEAQKQAQDLGNVPDYVTVPLGSDLIINLLSPFSGEAI